MLQALRIRDFRLLWFAGAVGMFGSMSLVIPQTAPVALPRTPASYCIQVVPGRHGRQALPARKRIQPPGGGS